MIRFVGLEKRQYESETLPEAEKNKLKESDQGSYYSQTEQWLEEFDVGVEVGASAK